MILFAKRKKHTALEGNNNIPGGSCLGPDGLLELVVSCHVVGIQVKGPTNGLSLNKSHWDNEILKRKWTIFWVDGKLSVVQILWPAAEVENSADAIDEDESLRLLQVRVPKAEVLQK